MYCMYMCICAYVECAVTALILIRTQSKIKKSDKHLKEIMKVLEVCSTVTVHVALLFVIITTLKSRTKQYSAWF